MSYLIQSCVALLGVFFLGWGITQLADRRLWRVAGCPAHPQHFYYGWRTCAYVGGIPTKW
jgi:hypothetical protein